MRKWKTKEKRKKENHPFTSSPANGQSGQKISGSRSLILVSHMALLPLFFPDHKQGAELEMELLRLSPT